VYAWNADPNHPVGSEFIIMEEAPGANLDDIWHDLPLEEKVAITKDLVSLEKKMLSVSLNKYDVVASLIAYGGVNQDLDMEIYILPTNLFKVLLLRISEAVCQRKRERLSRTASLSARLRNGATGPRSAQA
jgi:hypothetical protein